MTEPRAYTTPAILVALDRAVQAAKVRALQAFDRTLAEPYARHLGMVPASQRQPKPRDPAPCCACCVEAFAPAACPLYPHDAPCPEPSCGQTTEEIA